MESPRSEASATDKRVRASAYIWGAAARLPMKLVLLEYQQEFIGLGKPHTD
jgi:hypothetical protein